MKMRGKKSGERWKKKKARMANKAAKGKADEVDKQEEEVEVPLTRREEESEEDNDQESASDSESSNSSSDTEAEDGPKAKRAKSEAGKKWRNRQRVLVFGSRGIGARDRHLMDDLRSLLPHSRADSKMQRKETLFAINEIAEMKNCNKCLFFEGRRGRQDLYLWASSVARGPSAKFQVENVHTMAELKMTGNCLRGSRPLLTFDQSFEKEAHLRLLKELFTQIFSVPNHHPKSQPFFDHVYTFSVVDDKVWFRNFQIVEEDGSLAEIGPRFVLNPVKVFDASFSGRTLWDNPRYVTPTAHRFVLIHMPHFPSFLLMNYLILLRSMMKKMKAGKYLKNVQQKAAYQASRPTESTYALDKTDEVFGTIVDEEKEAKMKEIMSKRKPLKTRKRKKAGRGAGTEVVV